MTQHVYGPAPFMISKRFFDNLPEKYKTIIQNAALEARDYQRTTAKKISKESLKKLEEEGVNINYPDQGEFKKIAKNVYNNFKDKIDASLIETIQAAK